MRRLTGRQPQDPQEEPATGATGVIGNRLGRRLERRILETAAPQMDGETPRVCFRGETGLWLWVAILFILPPFFVIDLLIVRSRTVIVADRRIHIFQTKGSRGKIKRKLATLDRPAEVRLTRFSLTLGEERKIYGGPGTGSSGAMKAAATLAQQPPP